MADRKQALEIFSGLVAAIDWYDNSLQGILASRGLLVVNRTQAMMLIHVSNGMGRPSDIAKAMRTSKQNIHSMAKSLIENDVISVTVDPDDGRSRCYQLSDKKADQRSQIIDILHHLNLELSHRIGVENVDGLRVALSADWGSVLSEIERHDL